MTTRPHHFWVSCPRNLEFFPTQECPAGRQGISSDNSGCPWYINSSEHNFCFWSWVRANSYEDGSFPALKQQTILELLNISPMRYQILQREVFEKLKNIKEFKELF